MQTMFARVSAALLVLALAIPSAVAADLKVLSTIALRESWPALQPKFEAGGHKLEFVLNTSGALGKMIEGGATGDVIVSTGAFGAAARSKRRLMVQSRSQE